MMRLLPIALTALLALTACDAGAPAIGADGKPLPKKYRIGNAGKVQFRMLDSVNVLRSASGVAPVQLNSALNAAAETHSIDMSAQNRPWHFGSDGSSPLDRVARAGYQGQMLGENISETYESELQTLSAWMEVDDTRNVIIDSKATDLGFAWEQDKNGKIWWTLLTGRSNTAGPYFAPGT